MSSERLKTGNRRRMPFQFIILQVLSSSDVIDLKYRNGIATLSINEVFPEDEGHYLCVATNSLGTTKTECKLTIKRKYTIKYSLI